MFLVILFLIFLPVMEPSESYVRISESVTQFFPIDETILLLDKVSLSSYQDCVYACHQNDFCRVFDYDSLSQLCRLFEGDLQTTGLIGPSNSSTSTAGDFEQLPFLFSAYGQPCSACSEDRYLRCINTTCSCREHTYWTGNICASQSLYAASCTAAEQCRSDLNLTFLQFFQCGRKRNILFFRSRVRRRFVILAASLLAGTTIFGNANGSAGSSNTTLGGPWGISAAPDDTILIADPSNGRVILAQPDSRTPTAIIGVDQLSEPSRAIYDANMTNLYVLDVTYGCMMRFMNGSPNGTALFGSNGSALNQLYRPSMFVMDSQQDFYIADSSNHRIMFWSMYASSGVVVAGTTGVGGSGSSSLNFPTDVAPDEIGRFLYVSDHLNHRILRFKFNSTNGTVVAGGNGWGVERKQVSDDGLYTQVSLLCILVNWMDHWVLFCQRKPMRSTYQINTTSASNVGIWATVRVWQLPGVLQACRELRQIHSVYWIISPSMRMRHAYSFAIEITTAFKCFSWSDTETNKQIFVVCLFADSVIVVPTVKFWLTFSFVLIRIRSICCSIRWNMPQRKENSFLDRIALYVDDWQLLAWTISWPFSAWPLESISRNALDHIFCTRYSSIYTVNYPEAAFLVRSVLIVQVVYYLHRYACWTTFWGKEWM